MTLLLLIVAAHAAEVTQMPPALRGDVRIDYTAALEAGSLVEGDKAWGQRRHARHDLVYTAEFAPVDGFSIVLQVDTTPLQRLRFTDAHAMGYDPVLDQGTMAGSEPLEASPEHVGHGLNGLWLGVAAQPFAEAWGRGHPMTWRLDLAVRTPNPGRTFFSEEPRGTAPGGLGLRVRGAFSAEMAPADAYLVGDWLLEGGVADVDGLSGLRPASELDLLAGVELTVGGDPVRQEELAFDLFAGVGYRTWADIASGVVLPDVLERTEGTVVGQPEHLVGHAGLGAIYQPNRWFSARVAGTLGTVLPHRLEEPYPVRTGADTRVVGLQLGLEGRLR